MSKYIKNGKPKGFQKGDLNPSRKPERRKEISEWRKTHPTSAKTRKRQSISMKKRLKEPAMKEKWSKAATGRKLSLETIKKIQETRHKNNPLKMSSLTKMLDDIFSKYKRMINLKENGLITCFTCQQEFELKNIDCGHYISRQYKTVRWDEQNTEPQCKSCNRFHEGRKDVFALNLQKKYGDDILEKLNQRKNQIKKFTEYELQEMVKYYKDQVESLQRVAQKEQ